MKNKEDAKKDNIEKLEYNIKNTIKNYHVAEKAIEKTANDKTQNALEKKNEVREEAIKGMIAAIRDEQLDDTDGFR
jgi:small acid-soluble spore protein (thioredoxin-like protein)